MTDNHTDLTFVPGLGRATSCPCVEHHRPKPARFVWHHLLPQVCGGKTTPDNLVSICDNAHYAIHALLWAIHANGGKAPSKQGRVNAFITDAAVRGYAAAVAAGTTDRIPKESSE